MAAGSGAGTRQPHRHPNRSTGRSQTAPSSSDGITTKSRPRADTSEPRGNWIDGLPEGSCRAQRNIVEAHRKCRRIKFDPTQSPNTQTVLPSGIVVRGIQDWLTRPGRAALARRNDTQTQS